MNMKKYLLIILCIIYSTITLSAQYNVDCIESDGQTMTFRVTGYGKNAKVATQDAEINVIKALMFSGIPNTQQSIPMVKESESITIKNHKAFMKDFLETGYKQVITRSVIIRKFGKDQNKQKSIDLNVTVNVPALRNELQRGGVIRKFGL